MTDFEKRIEAYPAIKATYDSALKAATKSELYGDDIEYFLSKNCRAYFFEKYLKVERELADQEIRSVTDSPIIPYELSPVQLKLLDDFERRMGIGKKFAHRVMKCRRAKVSTIYLAISYHLARFNENKKGLVFADRLETSRKLRRILDIFYMTDSLCEKPVPGKKTMGEGMYFHDGKVDKNVTEKDSFILVGSGEQKNPGLGGSLDWLLWSEASLTADALKHQTTIFPSMQGAIFNVAESTPSLTGQDEIVFPAFEHPAENCGTFFIPWTEIPEYRIDDPKLASEFIPYSDHHLYGKEVEIVARYSPNVQQMLWRRFKLDELKSLDAFKQVFPISEEEAFYQGAGLFFHAELIKLTKPEENQKMEARRMSITDAMFGATATPDEMGAWTMWKMPLMSERYIVTADTAEGRSADKEGRDPDYSVAMVFALTQPIEEVAFLRERNIPPEIFGEQISGIAHLYNNALVVPERNSAGLAMLVRLLQLYTNVYREEKLKAGLFTPTNEYGFQTTSVNKVMALTSLMSLIRDKTRGLRIHSDLVRLELAKFQRRGINYCASQGYHDDTVTCCWLLAEIVSRTPSLLTPMQNRGLLGRPKMTRPTIERPDWNYAEEPTR